MTYKHNEERTAMRTSYLCYICAQVQTYWHGVAFRMVRT